VAGFVATEGFKFFDCEGGRGVCKRSVAISKVSRAYIFKIDKMDRSAALLYVTLQQKDTPGVSAYLMR
jgi:hypothetical protein